MIYFDNAATSFPKPKCVLRELYGCIEHYCGNPGRSGHVLSLKASEAIYSARERLADFLNVDTPETIVFTLNATYALNLAIKTMVKENCHVLISDFEHNSVVRPLEELRKSIGLRYTVFSTDGNIYDSVSSSIEENTVGIISSISSNVTGDKIDLEILSKIASQRGLFLIIDASQAAGHIRIDLEKTPVDALCAPGHKALFGIQGCGFAYFKEKERMESFIEGGSGSDSRSVNMPLLLPEGYEAGTLPTPAIVSLGGGVKYISEIGISEIEDKLNRLTAYLSERLASLPNLQQYKSGCGILSFNVKNINSSRVASILNDKGICVRGGLHCAPSIHKKLGTLERGAVRASLSYLNKFSEIEGFYKALKDITDSL